MIEGDAHRTEIEDTVMNRSQVGTSDTNPEDVCTDCGETLENDDAAFCPYCGTEL
jgi:rRNA maturation endonuclease Nob1